MSNALKSLNQPDDSHLNPVSPLKITNIIKSLLCNKVPGHNGITNTIIKRLSNRKILHINKIFKSCLRLKYFPIKWKHATIIMIPKQDKDLKIPSNYQLISIINTSAKSSNYTGIKTKNMHYRTVQTWKICFPPTTLQHHLITQTSRLPYKYY